MLSLTSIQVGGMPIVTVVMLALMGLLVLIGALKGTSRGFSRQFVRFVTIIISIVICIYLSRLAANVIMVRLGEMTTGELFDMLANYGLDLRENQIASILGYLETETLNYVVAIPLALVVVPVLFTLSFVLVSALMLIVHAVLSGVFGFFKNRNNGITRLGGAMLGAVQGLLVAIVLTVPIVGLCTTMTNAINTMRLEETDPSLSLPAAEQIPGENIYSDSALDEGNNDSITSAINAYDQNLKEYVEDPTIVFAGKFGGKFLYDTLSTVKVNDTKYKMTETISEPLVKIYPQISNLKEYEWKSPTSEQQESIRNIIDALGDSQYTSSLVTDLLSATGSAYKDGALPLELPSPLNEMVGSMIDSLCYMEYNELDGTLNALADAYFLLTNENVLTALEENPQLAAELLGKKDENGKTVINRLTTILSNNNRTSNIVDSIAKISITMMTDSLEIPGDAVEVYENVKQGVVDILELNKEDFATTEEYVATIQENLDTTLAENGIELEDEVLNTMATYVSDNYSEIPDVSEITDAEINDVIFSYYEAYLASTQN